VRWERAYPIKNKSATTNAALTVNQDPSSNELYMRAEAESNAVGVARAEARWGVGFGWRYTGAGAQTFCRKLVTLGWAIEGNQNVTVFSQAAFLELIGNFSADGEAKATVYVQPYFYNEATRSFSQCGNPYSAETRGGTELLSSSESRYVHHATASSCVVTFKSEENLDLYIDVTVMARTELGAFSAGAGTADSEFYRVHAKYMIAENA
jgi:hypothetical protein